MSRERDPLVGGGRPAVYRIRIGGLLDRSWEEWFEGMTITPDGGDTLITGPVIDQAALHGLLRRVRDVGLPLVSVTPIGGASAETAGEVDAPEPESRKPATHRSTRHVDP